MGSKLHSLTDVLKKTLFFFDELSVAEIVPHVHRKMLKDYTRDQVEAKVLLCLRQNPCFLYRQNEMWTLNLEGGRENDQFYSVLLKRQQPVSIREVMKAAVSNKSKKKTRPLVSGEAGLISDGRFIQLESGHWGLTEWEVEAEQYSLKNLIIKALKTHPGGLSVAQIFEIVNSWKKTSRQAVEGVIQKFPFFEEMGEGIWVYSPAVRVAYEEVMRRFLVSMNRQRDKWQRDRNRWKIKLEALNRQLHEVNCSHREVAAALAAKLEESGRYEHLVTQMAEKDLLLSLRKKEIYRYREHVSKLEAKANSILHQCRLWVKRAREAESDRNNVKEILSKNQASLEALFTKLQQYKERDRENKIRLADMKESNAVKVAGLQSEVLELKQKIERINDSHAREIKGYKHEISILSNDLKESLENCEEIKRSMRFVQQELSRTKSELRKLEQNIKSPPVRALIKVLSFFSLPRREKA
ncbi:MAG: phage-shock protein [Bacillota bacterium]